MELFADLHIHSCLSPCAEQEMTPNNIVHMAYLKGLQMISVTDHNSCNNLPAICAVAKELGITVVPGMEMETAEEVHTLAYFRTLADAMAFSNEAYHYLPPIPNNPQFFGEQTLMNENDEILGIEPRLLLSPLSLSLEEGVDKVRAFGGVAVPAHIERTSHGIIPILGFINPRLNFRTVEISPRGIAEGFSEYDPRLTVLTSSDAHHLGDILEQQQKLTLAENTANAFCDWLCANV